MKKTNNGFKNIVLIFVITIILLELISFVFLKFSSKNQSTSSGLCIFKQTNKKGIIEVNKSSVLPVKENLSILWKTNDFSVVVNTNRRGLRGKIDINNKDIDVAFFGDSYTFGQGVEDNGRFSYFFSQDSFFKNLHVLNFSYINGFEPEHYEYYLRSNTDLHPKNVIIGLYLGNDLGCDIEETKFDWGNNSLSIPYRLVSNNGTLSNNPTLYKFPINYLINVSSFVKLFVKTINNSHFREYLFNNKLKIHINQPNNVDLELGEEDLTKNRAILSIIRIQKLVNERGGKLTILLIPQNYFFTTDPKIAHIHSDLKYRINEVTQGNNILKATKIVLTKLNIDYFDPSKILNLQCYFKTDCHWNTKGHQIVGSALAKYIKNDTINLQIK